MSLYLLRLDPRNSYYKLGQTQDFEQRMRVHKGRNPLMRVVYVNHDAGLREERILRHLFRSIQGSYPGSQRELYELNEVQVRFISNLRSPEDFEEALSWDPF